MWGQRDAHQELPAPVQGHRSHFKLCLPAGSAEGLEPIQMSLPPASPTSSTQVGEDPVRQAGACLAIPSLLSTVGCKIHTVGLQDVKTFFFACLEPGL